MKKNILLYSILLAGMLFMGCKKDFLAPPSSSIALTAQAVFSDSIKTAGFLANIYANVYNESLQLNGNAWGYSSICDEVSDPITFNADASWINGSLNSQSAGLEGGLGGIYTTQYSVIRRCNLMFKYQDSMNFSPALKKQYLGEAHFLRGFFYFQLLERYGGVPLVSEVATVEQLSDNARFEAYKASVKRGSFSTIVQFILTDLEAAQAALPWYPPTTNDYGKATAAAAVGLKSRLMLYAASPLFNNPTMPALDSSVGYTSYDVNRWKLAADAAQEFLTLNTQNGNLYALYNNYQTLFLNGQDATNREIIWYRQTFPYSKIQFIPGRGGSPGNFSFAVTANEVDLYEMNNGKAIADPASGYSAANPFANRDPRLGYNVVKNGDTWFGYALQLYPGGLDYSGRTITGVAIRKYIQSSSPSGQKWCYLRLAEIYLNLAEALNEFQGPTADAYTALNTTRQRPSVTMPPVSGLTQATFRTEVQRERSVELAFENHRFFDLRRWMSPDISSDIMGYQPILSNNVITWNKVVLQQNLIVLPKMYLYPFPNAEVLKSNGVLHQNPKY